MSVKIVNALQIMKESCNLSNEIIVLVLCVMTAVLDCASNGHTIRHSNVYTLRYCTIAIYITLVLASLIPS